VAKSGRLSEVARISPMMAIWTEAGPAMPSLLLWPDEVDIHAAMSWRRGARPEVSDQFAAHLACGWPDERCCPAGRYIF